MSSSILTFNNGKSSTVEAELFRTTDPLPDPRRKSWLRRTKREIAKHVEDKFVLGQAQYQCDIGLQTVEYLLQQIEQEAIDQLMYVRELRRRMIKQPIKQDEIKEVQ